MTKEMAKEMAKFEIFKRRLRKLFQAAGFGNFKNLHKGQEIKTSQLFY